MTQVKPNTLQEMINTLPTLNDVQNGYEVCPYGLSSRLTNLLSHPAKDWAHHEFLNEWLDLVGWEVDTSFKWEDGDDISGSMKQIQDGLFEVISGIVGDLEEVEEDSYLVSDFI